MITGEGDGLRRARVAALLLAVAGLLAILVSPAPGRRGPQHFPTGFSDNVVISGLTEPTSVRFASDRARVRRREERARQGLRQPLRHDTDGLRRPPDETYNFWDRGLLGLALAPNFPTSPYVYVLYTYDQVPGDPTQRRVGDARRVGRPCPTPPGPTPTAASSPLACRGSRPPETSCGIGAGARRGLVSAVPEPLGRRGRVRPRRRPVRERRATAPASSTPTTARRNPLNPCGDPPGR